MPRVSASLSSPSLPVKADTRFLFGVDRLYVLAGTLKVPLIDALLVTGTLGLVRQGKTAGGAYPINDGHEGIARLGSRLYVRGAW